MNPGRQHPIGSGFGAHSTAAEVLEGVDLTGRSALVTGGYSGIGLEVVRALVAVGAHVYAPARRPDPAREALGGLHTVEIGALDLADQASVEAYADGLLQSGEHLDVVIDNAGVMACPEHRVGPGWELQMATNHLGHYALVNRLWPLIDGGARVVSVSSLGHDYSGIRWSDPWFTGGYDKWHAYGQSKTANILFAVHLDRLGQDRGVRAFSLHPGAILTSLGRHLRREDMSKLLDTDDDGVAVMPELKTPEEGAATSVWAATSPQLDGLGGLFLQDCEVAEMARDGSAGGGAHGVKAYALDGEDAERLWTWSAQLTGVNAFGS